MVFILYVFLLSCFTGDIEGMYYQELQRRLLKPAIDAKPVPRPTIASHRFLETLQQRDYVATIALLDKRIEELSINCMFEGKYLICEAINTRNKLIITPLTRKYAKLYHKNSSLYLSALNTAVKTLDIDIVRLVLAMHTGSRVIEYDNYINTIIRDSASTVMSYEKSCALIKLLMSNDAIAKTVRRNYMKNALSRAIEYGRTDVLCLLFEHRDCLNMKDPRDIQVLIKAFRSKSPPVVQVILDHTGWYESGAQLFILKCAVKSDDLSVVKSVLSRMRCEGQPMHAMIGEVIGEAIMKRRKIAVINRLIDCFAVSRNLCPNIYTVHDRVNEERGLITLRGEEQFVSMLDQNFKKHREFHGDTILSRMIAQVDSDTYVRDIVHLLITRSAVLGIEPREAERAAKRIFLSQKTEQGPFVVRTEECDTTEQDKNLYAKINYDINALLFADGILEGAEYESKE